MAIARYEVLITPQINADEYGATVDVTKDIDVSDLIRQGGLGSIKREVENGDFDVGVFTFGYINLTCINYSGRFSDPHDWRSIFSFRRDLAKVEVNFFDEDENETLVFRGLVNEEASKDDFNRQIVTLRVLSLDSIFRKSLVAGGAVQSGLASDAIKTILNTTEITTVLNYSPSNINVDQDVSIDDPSWFDNRTVKQALDSLMLATNSILLIDDSDNIIVRSREPNAATHYFYGAGDIYGRENIVALKNFNTGVQRSFNSVRIGDEFALTDENFRTEYGIRQKTLDFPYVTTAATIEDIGTRFLREFKWPKMECEIVVPTRIASGVEILDLVSVDFPKVVKPYDQNKIPIAGQAIAGEAVFPHSLGSFSIAPIIKWKVIGITENPSNFETTLKLRQAGIRENDGVFA